MMTPHTRKSTVSTDEWKRNLRRSARVKTNFQLTVRCTVQGGEVIVPGYARNISAEGVGTLVPVNLEIDQQVEMQFTLPGSNRELKVQGIVRASDEFFYGIEFLDIDAAARRLLRAFVLP